VSDLLDLRRYVDESTETVYTDADLLTRISTATSLYSLAADIWLEKAARYSRLVDMQEGSSSRKLSQLSAHAMQMSAQYAARATSNTSALITRPTVLRDIERP